MGGAAVRGRDLERGRRSCLHHAGAHLSPTTREGVAVGEQEEAMQAGPGA